ncbi:hypothetical protein AURDEDRAFT_68231 [Auricularia subglabra TFB-10046 SS5]|nr:hypothetical protein AURDEDRAFT_68231 [Auricularia subglabra TFB-10046 SS5]
MLLAIAVATALFFCSSTALTALESVARVRTVSRFPNGTWVENIAVRSNGHLLVTLLSAPEVWDIDPVSGLRRLVAQFFPTPGVGAGGIAEVAPDVFAVATNNVTVAPLNSILNSGIVWLVDLRGTRPSVKKVTDIPEASSLNGMTRLDGRGRVLVSDPGSGTVFRVDTRTGAVAVAVQDPLFTAPPPPALQLGVNGIRLRGRDLFFANSGKGLLGHVPIRADGTAAGAVRVIATDITPDDFALRPGTSREAFACLNPDNTVALVASNGTVAPIAGSIDSTLIPNPTSAQFGRTIVDAGTLYVTTAGGLASPVNGTFIEGGKVVAIDVRHI